MGGEESGSIASAVLAAPFRAAGEQGLRAGADRGGRPGAARRQAGSRPPALPVEVYVYALDAGGAIQDFLFQSLGLDLAKAEPASCARAGSSSSATSTCRPASTRCAPWCATAPPAPSACGWCR